MTTRLHGVDRHVRYSTISVLDLCGEETHFQQRCLELETYCKTLGPEDAVAVEMSGGVFHLADMIEATGAKVCVVDPRRFKIICESKSKTDKNDARRLARGLYGMVTGGDMLPMVYKADRQVRSLRRLFGVYIGFRKQITALKNGVQGYRRDIGVRVNTDEKAGLFNNRKAVMAMSRKSINDDDRRVVAMMLEALFVLQEKKAAVEREILSQGAFLQKEVELLLTIRGMSPLLAQAFLADVGDIRRFKNLRKLSAYLGVVPSTDSSGGKTGHGRCLKESRKLTRTLFTQAVRHFTESSTALKDFYQHLVYRRGIGRARIAVIRKIIAIMRRMLLRGEPYRSMEQELTEAKTKKFRRRMAVLQVS